VPPSRVHIIIVANNDFAPPKISPRAAVMHARAVQYRTRYRAGLFVLLAAIPTACLMSVTGASARVVLVCVLASMLTAVAGLGFAAFTTRKDFLG
jgi:hypothetical protein